MGRLIKLEMFIYWLLFRLLSLFRPRFDISPGGKPYLIRWYLTPTGKSKFAKWYRRHCPGVFLHCFLSSDPDRGWHSHPWEWAWSLILRGSYLESRPSDGPYFVLKLVDVWNRLNPGDTNKIIIGDYHKVKLLTPKVWTLFVVGPLHGGEWSFMNEQGEVTPHGTDTPGD